MNENNYPNLSVPQTETVIPQEEKEILLANENDKVKRILTNFQFFGVLSIVYGIFYCFCLYKNKSGITMPLFMAGTFVYFITCMKKLEITLKKDAWFYIVTACLLGVSNFLTTSGVLIFFNCTGMTFLVFGFLLHHFYEDRQWRFGKQFSAIFTLFFGSIGNLHYLPKSFSYYNRKKEAAKGKDSKMKYVWLGILIAIPLLMVVCACLMSADAVFREIFQDLFKNLVVPEHFVGIAFTTVFAMLGSFGMIVWLSKKQLTEECPSQKTWEPLIAITVTSLMAAIYVLFSAIQIVYLFMGNMKLPAGYNYAEYAREGFFELLFVCMINLFIVLVCVERFKDHIVLKIILSIFSACTYIMIASSAMRMILYVRTYDLTFLRVLVLWTLAVLALLLAGLLISIYKKEFLLFRYCMVVVTLCYLIFSFSKPDYYIAKYNINKAVGESVKEMGSAEYDYPKMYLDESYLFYNLSLDAAPVLAEAGILKPEADLDDADYGMEYYYDRIKQKTEDMGIRNFNLSAYKAKKILDGLVNGAE